MKRRTVQQVALDVGNWICLFLTQLLVFFLITGNLHEGFFFFSDVMVLINNFLLFV